MCVCVCVCERVLGDCPRLPYVSHERTSFSLTYTCIETALTSRGKTHICFYQKYIPYAQ